MNVLLLDDCPSIRAILRVFLLGVASSFVEAQEGERALKLLRLSKVDLVIADVRMEPLDGIGFLRRVRSDENRAVREVPVILLTSDTSPALREQGLAAGANAFVHKPVEHELLRATVRRVMGVVA